VLFDLISLIDNYFQGALQLLRRLSPSCIIANRHLFSYLFQRKSYDKSAQNSSVFSSVIQNSPDSIFFLNINETIEMVNSAVTSLLDYASEQLLGQHISFILPSDQSQTIFTQMSLMKDGQCSLMFEYHIRAKTDNETFIPVHVILFGMEEVSESKAKSFVIILRNELQLQLQMKKAQEAKAQSEELLYSILPRDIVTKINQGEKNISFSVSCVSVIFVDIVKFRQYSFGLSPS
jgi:PAS domain S-box-containing protein